MEDGIESRWPIVLHDLILENYYRTVIRDTYNSAHDITHVHGLRSRSAARCGAVVEIDPDEGHEMHWSFPAVFF